ncbi:hypothetical protein AAFF_G00041800 [Aldrovandia affinis]|uniref:Uncharacterized protein n=1 Tax=Aldrovandia affinis TaxID=143900 RepID=A0AAD7S2J6_9TELE|nr:hypothetical protein AAFF_G00041800 [Aldrovandia affinis]
MRRLRAACEPESHRDASALASRTAALPATAAPTLPPIKARAPGRPAFLGDLVRTTPRQPRRSNFAGGTLRRDSVPDVRIRVRLRRLESAA